MSTSSAPRYADMNGTWINDTIAIPPYLGLDGSEQAGLIGGFFVLCIMLTMMFFLLLFNPFKMGCQTRDGADSWCYLCCTCLFFRCYNCCCCKFCCTKHRKWVNKKAETVKELIQTQNELDWGAFVGDDGDSAEDVVTLDTTRIQDAL